MKRGRIIIFIILFFVVLSAVLLILKNFSDENGNQNIVPEIASSAENIISKSDCVSDIRAEENIVRGGSLSGFIENGEKVIIYYGYYNCNEVERGDAVIYKYAGNKEPLIKIVKAVPGDCFELKENNGRWNISVNDEILKNSAGENYNFNYSAYRMLHLYENDYQGIIPGGAYLLLGNLVSGTLDSTRFGLVGKNDILGKAVPVDNP